MKTDILNVKIDALTQVQVLEKISQQFDPNAAEESILKNQQIITANPEILLEAAKNEVYKNLINNSSLVVADGIGLLWAAKFLSLKSDHLLTSLIQSLVCGASLMFSPAYVKEILPERITGVDLLEKICELASRKNWKIYLLGGVEGIAQKTSEVLTNRFLNLNIAGAEEGLANYTVGDNLNEMADRIKSVQPDILFVAMGSPKQDFLIKQILPQLPSIKLAMGVGGAFDFISGQVKRAPIIYRDLGVEWLWRLINQPWRFFRILNATVRFMWNVIKFKNIYSNT